uniref:Integrase catalytic domain-containing protein n=1 Tax=Vitis vinifera TaxID=29760 RepID=A5B0T5_VITVI|nr:hypothetical protein VITISV_007976 [Vitis vinifera]
MDGTSTSVIRVSSTGGRLMLVDGASLRADVCLVSLVGATPPLICTLPDQVRESPVTMRVFTGVGFTGDKFRGWKPGAGGEIRREDISESILEELAALEKCGGDPSPCMGPTARDMDGHAGGQSAWRLVAQEHSGGERHFDVDWSPIIEDLYSPELGFMDICVARNPLGCRGSVCVEVMPTLYGSTPSLRRRAEGCVLPEGTIASAKDLLKSIDTFSLGSTSWIRVEGRLIKVSDQSDQRSYQIDMDSQIVTVDQFAETMTSIQEAIASLGRRIDGQQAQQVLPQDGAQYDHTVPPPPPPSQSAPQAMPFTLHSQTEVAPPPITVPTPTSEDPRARMDRLEQRLRQLRTSDRAITYEDFDGAPMASLPAKFRMPEIERYTGIGCPRIHLRLYSTIMRAHGLDEDQMIMLFPMSLSGAAQRWFASLDVSRRRTWDDLAQEFLRQYAFNTVIDVSRRELEALRQRTDESVSSFISRWWGKIAEIIDRPPKRDQIQMVLRSLQPRIARHLVGVPFIDFGSLVSALYNVEDGISRGLWTYSSPSDIKGKKPFVGQRSMDVSTIGSSSQRPLMRHQPIPQLSEPHSSYAPHQYRPRAPRPAYDQTYTPQTLALPYYASQGIKRPPALRKLTEAGLLTALAPRPPPQPIPPQFRMDLHCAYHQRPGHETDRCTALRHAVQDLIDQGLVHLGQPSVTMNPLPAHTTHAIPHPADDIRFLDFDEIDDHVHMLSDDDSDLEPIMSDVIYEMSGVTLGPPMLAPFRLVPEAASVQAATVEPLILPHYSVRTPFILIPDVEEVQALCVDDPQTLDVHIETVRRSADGMLLLCLDRASTDRVMREVHAEVCGPHMGGHMLARKIMKTSYFWLTMETDCCQFVQRCPECQIHGDLIHVSPSELHALTSPWLFSVWGIDIIGKISPKSSSGHEFILVAIDYFTKSHIIYHYGVPHELISDRGVYFRAEVDTLVQQYGIRHHRSFAYKPQTNGAVEAANKNIKRILRRMVETFRDWLEKLPFALWAYRTSFRTSIGATPYSLVYGMETVLPVEIEMGSLRVALEQQIPETDWAQARFDQLNLLDERRLRAADHVRAYQRKMARAFKKRVKPRPLRIGDLVLKVIRELIRDPRGKFRPNWSGPYFIRELTLEGTAWLMDLDGNQFSELTNVDQLKRYYV